MSSLEIILIVIAAEFLVFAAFAVPFLYQIWRAARNMSVTLEAVNQNLPAIMHNLEGITANVNKATCTVNQQVEGLALAMESVKRVLGIGMDADCRRAEAGPFLSAVRMVNAAVKGACVFFEVFRSRR